MKKYSIIAALVALVFGLLGFVASATSATAATADPATLPSCVGINTDIGKGDCIDQVMAKSSSSASVEAKVESINGVSIHSKVTVLANIKANGTPQNQQTDCYTLPRAMSLWTSYNAEGTTGWHWKSYPKGYKFCMINGKVRDPKCHNQVKIGVPKSNPPKNAIKGKVKFVKRLKFQMSSVSSVSEEVSAKAKSWCNTANTHAYGEGNGHAVFSATGRATLRGSVKVELEAAVNAASQGDLLANLAAQGIVDIKAKAKSAAFGQAHVEASSKAVCQETVQPTPTPTTTPTPTPPPCTQQCEPAMPAPRAEGPTVNDVLVNNERNMTFTGKLAKGTTGKASASAGTGTIVSSSMVNLTTDADGYFTVTFRYRAGDEPGRDTVTLVVDQSDGQSVTTTTMGRDAAGNLVPHFEVRAAPIDPM